MSEATGIQIVKDANIREVTGAPRAVLIIGKSDCGHCIRYEREIVELLERGEFEGVTFGKLLLDAPGAPRFKRENPWLASLDALPHTLIFVDGKHVENFAASRAAYLQERLEAVATAAAGEA